MTWTRNALKRLIAVVPMLFAVSLPLFGVRNVLPGGPEALDAGENLDPATIADVRQPRSWPDSGRAHWWPDHQRRTMQRPSGVTSYVS